MLLLVLDDEAEGEAAGEERVVRIELDVVEHLERPCPHVVEVRAGGTRVEQLERRSLLALVGERVVRVVRVRVDRWRAAEPPADPQLLEVADVREVPHERGHEG